ncbi:FadR/GntR family transcriptional regulator [Halalkalibacter oceani]|uniref:FadR/GntR family transcriptional regulator n=1 Tax=Halalkalibacter oceani TaxID=1653776 RepID=UPI00339362A9
MKPISKTNRKFEEVLLRIKDDIVQRNLQPGDKLLPEREMSEVLQVSRTSVREALRVLEFFDVIQSKPGEGTTLRNPQVTKLITNLYPFLFVPTETSLELLESRKILEGGVAMLASERRKQSDIDHMQFALEKMKSRNLEEQINADLDFHKAMSNAAYNKTLSEISFVVSDIVTRNLQSNGLKMYSFPEVSEELYKQHASILEAIMEGDGEKAKKALEQNLDYSIEIIKMLDGKN